MPQGIALLGAGLFATEAYLPALAALGNKALSLQAVYSRSLGSAAKLSQAATRDLGLKHPPSTYCEDLGGEGDLDVLLARDDIAAVLIVLPINLQPEIILKCLAAGKHVLSEKPAAPDVKTGLHLIKTYRAEYQGKGLVWRVAENYEAEPVFKETSKIIRSGKLGKLNFFRITFTAFVDPESNKWYKTPWRTIPEYQGGFLLDGGVHTIGALRTILPSPITHLAAFASLNKEILKPHDTIQCIAKSDSGFHGTIDLTFASPTQDRPVADDYVFFGEKGWLTVNLYKPRGEGKIVNEIKIQYTSKDENGKTVDAEETSEYPVCGVELELLSFFSAVLDRSEDSLGDPVGALQDVAFIQAALASEGKLVDVDALTKI